MMYDFDLPTAGDIERELPEPVGEGEGRTPAPIGPPTLSLLLQPVTSCEIKKRKTKEFS